MRLLRDVHVNTELYTNLLNSAQQLRMAKAGQVGNVRVVDFAEAPDDPVRPKRADRDPDRARRRPRARHHADLLQARVYGGVERPDELESQLGVPRVRHRAAQPDAVAVCRRMSALRRAGCMCSPHRRRKIWLSKAFANLRTSLQLSARRRSRITS